MSEYQYYEFLALDKPLTPAQIEAVGQFSSRADISTTRFVNTYNYGDFRGDETDFLTRYFDLHVYVANWGTRRFALALPAQLLDLPVVKDYQDDDSFDIQTKSNRLILTFTSQEEGGDGDYGGAGWMASLAPLREELSGGDLRVLYLAWLVAVTEATIADELWEPPVPAGLRKLTAAQKSFVSFMRIDPEILEVAAQVSPELNAAQPDAPRFLAGLPAQGKDAFLLAVLEGRATEVARDLRTRLRRAYPLAGPAKSRRTVGALRAAAKKLATEHERIRAEENARQKAVPPPKPPPPAPNICAKSPREKNNFGNRCTTVSP